MQADHLGKLLDLAKPALFNAKMNSGGSVPHLSCFYFSEDNVTAYNGVMGITVALPELALEECCLNGDALLSLIKSLGKQEVGLYREKDEVYVTGGKTKVHLPYLSAEEFPYKKPKINTIAELQLTPQFLGGLSFCERAVLPPRAADRAALSCITLVIEGQEVVAYSTDNQVICKAVVQPSKKKKTKAKANKQTTLLPGEFCSNLLNIYHTMGGAGGYLNIGKNSVEAMVCDEDGVFLGAVHSSMMENIKSFPYQKTVKNLLAQVEDTPAVPYPKEFETALKRSKSFIATGLSYSCEVQVEDSELALRTETPNGEIDDTVDLPDPHEEPAQLEVDPNRVLTSFKGCNEFHASDEVIIGYSGDSCTVIVSARESSA